VGDLAFQRKCFDRMEDLIQRQNARFCWSVTTSAKFSVYVEGLSFLSMAELGKLDCRNPFAILLCTKRSKDKSGRTSHGAAIQSSGDIEVLNIAFIGTDGAQIENLIFNQDCDLFDRSSVQ